MRHFIYGYIRPKILMKLFNAAHAAPSVGFIQPWRFIRIKNSNIRHQIKKIVEYERIKTAKTLKNKNENFLKLKIEGIKNCAELIIVCLTNQRNKYIFGRRTINQMDLASTSCAIQNMWLAARAEGLGMGWVSIFEPKILSKLLNLPQDAITIAILCLGHVKTFYKKPMLEIENWNNRKNLNKIIMQNKWQDKFYFN